MTSAIRREIVCLIVACLLAGGVRWVGLLEQSFWFDEAMSWRTSILPWDAMLRSLSRNTHPPLYFAVLKAWIGLWGESVTALRSLNVVIAMLTPPFIFLCCREAANVDRNQLVQLRQEPDVVPLPELRKALIRPTVAKNKWQTSPINKPPQLNPHRNVWATLRLLIPVR